MGPELLIAPVLQESQLAEAILDTETVKEAELVTTEQIISEPAEQASVASVPTEVPIAAAPLVEEILSASLPVTEEPAPVSVQTEVAAVPEPTEPTPVLVPELTPVPSNPVLQDPVPTKLLQEQENPLLSAINGHSADSQSSELNGQ